MKTNDQVTAQAAGDQGQSEFDLVKTRLEQIADAVSDESLSLDEALDLYEEAVSLGLQVSDLLEVGVSPEEEEARLDEAAESSESNSEQPDAAVSNAAASAE